MVSVSTPHITPREEFISIRLLTEKQLAQEMQLDRITLWRWRTQGMPYLSLGTRTVRYRLLDVQEWLRDREAASRAVRGQI
jgi:predicted DNA-binding transcriptional regulator AlpA